jgi:predicted GNAT family N-acyltransferase
VTQQEIEEDLNRAPVARVLAYRQGELVACAEVFQRQVDYGGQPIVVGGFGPCTREDVRGQGIGTRVCLAAMDYLQGQGCDVAFLSVDTSRGSHPLYERLGFRMLSRPFTYANVRGEPKESGGGMVAPLRSQALFERELRGDARSILRLLACLAWALSATTACARGGQVPNWPAEIDRAEETWQGCAIDDYHIVVRDSSLWHLQTYDILVRDGTVAEASATCEPAPIEGRTCEVRPFDPEDYAVPGLFARGRQLAKGGDPRWIAIEFDADYGYPTLIRYNDPEVMDEEWAWGVQTFEVLE